jgi:hypothetical protein
VIGLERKQNSLRAYSIVRVWFRFPIPLYLIHTQINGQVRAASDDTSHRDQPHYVPQG